MATLLDRIAAARGRGGGERRFSVDGWLSEYMAAMNQFSYNGATYPFGLNQTLAGRRSQEVSATLPGYAAALRHCPPAFAAEMVRALVMSQARFTFRNTRASGTPGKLFGTRDLTLLERPWPNGTTGELLSKMEWHAGLAGNAYVYRQSPTRLRVLRPDWVTVVYGSDQEPEEAAHALDGELVGYIYKNGGMSADTTAHTLTVDEVAHWSPLPDPECVGVGMSWITPAVREIQGDRAASEHKLRFFENGATPNMVVKGIPAATREQFETAVDAMESRHTGVANAYRTLYLAAGADATVVGSDLRQLDFKNTQGTGETRIAFLSRVPAPLLGISEGLAGAALNAGNFGQARRSFADTWVYPMLQDAAAALAPLVRVPSNAELWFDTGDMPILREDELDAAEIDSRKMSTIEAGVRAGFEPYSLVEAVAPEWAQKMRHTGLYSVQLQPPGTQQQASTPDTAPDNGATP